MISVTCPKCGHTFPVIPVESDGWCLCGADYEIGPDGRVTWR